MSGSAQLLNFPQIRIALWDQTPQDHAHLLVGHLQAPKVHITAHATALLAHHLKTLKAKPDADAPHEHPVCFLIAQVVAQPASKANFHWDRASPAPTLRLVVDRFDAGFHDAESNILTATLLNNGEIVLPVFFKEATRIVERLSQQVLKQYSGSLQPLNLTDHFAVSFLCHDVTDSNKDSALVNLSIQVDCVLPSVGLHMTPINPISMVATPLVSHLMSAVREHTSGFLSLNSHRNLLLLSERDPIGLQRPVVGVWIASADSVEDPFVWAACMRFLHYQHFQERVMMQTACFLVLLFTEQIGSHPSLFECSASIPNSAVFAPSSMIHSQHSSILGVPRLGVPTEAPHAYFELVLDSVAATRAHEENLRVAEDVDLPQPCPSPSLPASMNSALPHTAAPDLDISLDMENGIHSEDEDHYSPAIAHAQIRRLAKPNSTSPVTSSSTMPAGDTYRELLSQQQSHLEKLQVEMHSLRAELQGSRPSTSSVNHSTLPFQSKMTFQPHDQAEHTILSMSHASIHSISQFHDSAQNVSRISMVDQQTDSTLSDNGHAEASDRQDFDELDSAEMDDQYYNKMMQTITHALTNAAVADTENSRADTNAVFTISAHHETRTDSPHMMSHRAGNDASLHERTNASQHTSLSVVNLARPLEYSPNRYSQNMSMSTATNTNDNTLAHSQIFADPSFINSVVPQQISPLVVPRINYDPSLALAIEDEEMDEADQIALKYLDAEGRKALLHQRDVPKDSTTTTDLSFDTREYLQRNHLLDADQQHNAGDNVNILNMSRLRLLSKFE